MLSCQHSKNVIDGKKRVILAPSQEQRGGFDTVTFAEGEVYGMDILVSSGEDGRVSIRYIAWVIYFNMLKGTSRRVSHDCLPTGFGSYLFIKNENFPCCVLRSTKESRFFPIQHASVG